MTSPSAALSDLVALQAMQLAVAALFSTSIPVTGNTVVAPHVANAPSVVQVVPAGTLATLIFTLPVAPVDGQKITFISSQIITALSFTAGPTITGGPTSMAVNTPFTLQYFAALAGWIRVQ